MTRYVVASVAGQGDDEACLHLGQLTGDLPASEAACIDCLREGSRWLHLRQCLTCGQVRCCDDSPRRHATAHWNSSSHPLIRSFEPGETWAWCYPDDLPLVPADDATA
jgi:CPA1 family monovalent cation:H+ antiporter